MASTIPQTSSDNYKIIDSDTVTDCPICLEDFDDITCSIITCGCGIKVCLSCAKESLMNTTKDPHCFNCHRGWDREFQYKNFGNTWINKTYKEYRKGLLLEREKARMPDTQQAVEEYMKVGDYKKQLADMIKIEKELKEAHQHAKYELRIMRTKINRIQKGHIDVTDEEKKKFVKKCPVDDCRGFLSTSYKCALCKVFVCPDCHEVIGHSRDEEHKCDEDTVETIKMMKKETKPCPTCATPIFKVSGCDQMWCTQCQVAFSWNKGTIEKGVVHNPHYYQWMKENNGNIQNPGAEVCGGIPTYFTLRNLCANINKQFANNKQMKESKKLRNMLDIYIEKLLFRSLRYLLENISGNTVCRYEHLIVNITSVVYHIHRTANHNLHTIIDPMRLAVNGAIDNKDLRIKYLAKEIDDKHLMTMIARRDNIREKKLAMLQVFELYNNVVTEFLNSLLPHTEKIGIYNEAQIDDMFTYIFTGIIYMYDTAMYCNKQLMTIANNYKMKVHFITELEISNGMYNYNYLNEYLKYQNIVQKELQEQVKNIIDMKLINE